MLKWKYAAVTIVIDSCILLSERYKLMLIWLG